MKVLINLGKPSTRYNKLKKLSVDEMAPVLSWYFGCDRCPAKKGACSDNDAMCIDAIRDWLNAEGEL